MFFLPEVVRLRAADLQHLLGHPERQPREGFATLAVTGWKIWAALSHPPFHSSATLKPHPVGCGQALTVALQRLTWP